MIRLFSRIWRTGVIARFLTGLFFLLPVVLTIVIIQWLVEWLRGALGPGSFLGDLLTRGGQLFVGSEYDLVAFWLGILIVLAGIWLTGVIVTWQARKRFDRTLDEVLTRVPFFRTVYGPVSRVVRLVSSQNPEEFAGMSVVTCRFGGKDGVDVLALLASPETFLIGGEKRKIVYLPSSPIPMTGALVLVPEASVVPAPDMQLESLMKVYFSLGSLAPESLPAT